MGHFRGVKNGHFGKSAKFDGTLEYFFFHFFQKKSTLFLTFLAFCDMAKSRRDMVTPFLSFF